MVSSGGELVSHRGSGGAYIPIPRKFRCRVDGDCWRHAPTTKVQVTKGGANPAPEPEVAGKGSCCSFFCRSVQNVQVHVLWRPSGRGQLGWSCEAQPRTDKNGEVGPTFLTNFISTASFREYSCQLRPKSIQSINQVYFHRLRSIDTVMDKYRHIYISSRILGIRPVRQIPMFNHNVLEWHLGIPSAALKQLSQKLAVATSELIIGANCKTLSF